MMSQTPLFECVPNVSEGRDTEKIVRLVATLEASPGITLLDVYRGASTNRTVFTFVGDGPSIKNAAFRLIAEARSLIDMRTQSGAHPRIGATDVCPIIPINEADLPQAIAISKTLAEQVARELNIPVYLYEFSASSPKRAALPFLRKGGYENLRIRNADSTLLPDYGSLNGDLKSGATIIGARDFLVAINFTIKSTSATLADEIAKALRESNGGLKKLRAIGWYLEDLNCAQVSCNLLDFKQTPLEQVYERVSTLAALKGTQVTGSELIGLIPRQALLSAGRYFCKSDVTSDADDTSVIQYAIEKLGLSNISPFIAEKRILESRLSEIQK